jgi:hypothetical protein
MEKGHPAHLDPSLVLGLVSLGSCLCLAEAGILVLGLLYVACLGTRHVLVKAITGLLETASPNGTHKALQVTFLLVTVLAGQRCPSGDSCELMEEGVICHVGHLLRTETGLLDGHIAEAQLPGLFHPGILRLLSTPLIGSMAFFNFLIDVVLAMARPMDDPSPTLYGHPIVAWPLATPMVLVPRNHTADAVWKKGILRVLIRLLCLVLGVSGHVALCGLVVLERVRNALLELLGLLDVGAQVLPVLGVDVGHASVVEAPVGLHAEAEVVVPVDQEHGLLLLVLLKVQGSSRHGTESGRVRLHTRGRGRGTTCGTASLRYCVSLTGLGSLTTSLHLGLLLVGQGTLGLLGLGLCRGRGRGRGATRRTASLCSLLGLGRLATGLHLGLLLLRQHALGLLASGLRKRSTRGLLGLLDVLDQLQLVLGGQLLHLGEHGSVVGHVVWANEAQMTGHWSVESWEVWAVGTGR